MQISISFKSGPLRPVSWLMLTQELQATVENYKAPDEESRPGYMLEQQARLFY